MMIMKVDRNIAADPDSETVKRLEWAHRKTMTRGHGNLCTLTKLAML